MNVVYQVRVEGQLDGEWSNWFDGMTIAPQANGDTVLSGAIVDQAALFGVLKKIRDLGMTLVSVNRVKPPSAKASVVKPSLARYVHKKRSQALQRKGDSK